MSADGWRLAYVNAVRKWRCGDVTTQSATPNPQGGPRAPIWQQSQKFRPLCPGPRCASVFLTCERVLTRLLTKVSYTSNSHSHGAVFSRRVPPTRFPNLPIIQPALRALHLRTQGRMRIKDMALPFQALLERKAHVRPTTLPAQ